MKFSITISAYKVQFLRECIDSILCQTYKDFELIILNDCSPENIQNIVDSFNDQRISYYCNTKNVGAYHVVDNWNRCLLYAKGDYIICMGDDDKLLPNCLEEYNKLIDKYPNLNVFHAWTEIIDENSKPTKITEARPEYESVYSLIWHRFCGRQQFIGDFLFKTETLKKNKGFYKLPLAWGSDDITAIIATSELGIANTQSLCFQYRASSRTISRTGNTLHKLEALSQHNLFLSVFLEKEPKKSIDIELYDLIKNNFDKYFERRIAEALKENIKERFTHPKRWRELYYKYNISYKIRFRALALGFKDFIRILLK